MPLSSCERNLDHLDTRLLDRTAMAEAPVKLEGFPQISSEAIDGIVPFNILSILIFTAMILCNLPLMDLVTPS